MVPASRMSPSYCGCSALTDGMSLRSPTVCAMKPGPGTEPQPAGLVLFLITL